MKARRTLYNNIVFNSSRYKTLYKYLQGTSTRCAHDDIRRLSSYITTVDEKHTKPKHSRKPGVGGTSEEKSISQALRIIHERNYQVIIEVMNACHVDWAEKQLPIRKDHNKIWARVLTHSDLLSKEALQYQMERASIVRNRNSSSVGGDGGSTYQIPVVALNLQDTTIKNSKLRPIMEMLYGAKVAADASKCDQSITTTTKLLVCGVPNAGKSSFIYPLTKHRTLQVKKKKGSFHLPSINIIPGWTMVTKSHAFDIKVLKDSKNGGKHHKTKSVGLDDTPGIRPRLETLMEGNNDDELLAKWLSTRGIGMLSKKSNNINHDNLEQQVIQILWRGLKRHAEISQSSFEFDSSDSLWERHLEGTKVGTNTTLDSLTRAVSSGVYGGCIIEEEEHTPMSKQGEYTINQDSTIVAMNQSAKLLVDIGSGKVEFDRIKHSQIFLPRFDNRMSRRGSSRRQAEENSSRLPRRTSPPHSSTKQSNIRHHHLDHTIQQKPEESSVNRLPEHMQRLECLKCAGFVKENRLGELFGKSFPKVINWKEDDICAFYSRILEVFDEKKSRHVKHLMLDSLVLTIKQKQKLASKSKVYKNEVNRKLAKKFPVRSETRPKPFRSDQPIPLKSFVCTNRSNSSCKIKSQTS